MGFTVEDLLQVGEAKKLSVICGEKGLKNEIKGVTIIEAPILLGLSMAGNCC